MEQFTIDVGWTSVRPVIPDQHWSRVVVATDRGLADAKLLAAQIVGTHAVMPTSTHLVSVDI